MLSGLLRQSLTAQMKKLATLRANDEPHKLAKEFSFEPLAANRWCAANSRMGLLKKQ
jgi:hypothetical protein